MLMYLAWEWDTRLFASAMHPKLSTYITIAWVRGKLSSVKRVQSHIASLIVFIDVMYSVSTEEVTTIVCFLENQAIELPTTLNIKLLVDLWLLMS